MIPREEDLPPSKRSKLSREVTKETKRFYDFVGEGDKYFSLMTDKQQINWLVTYINHINAVNRLSVEVLIERIERLENLLKE